MAWPDQEAAVAEGFDVLGEAADGASALAAAGELKPDVVGPDVPVARRERLRRRGSARCERACACGRVRLEPERERVSVAAGVEPRLGVITKSDLSGRDAGHRPRLMWVRVAETR